MKALIVGQAPARTGDGRPFDGRSGARLCLLLGIKSRAALAQMFDLDNLIGEKLPRRETGKGDKFHVVIAEHKAKQLLETARDGQEIIACGRQVWNAFGLRGGTWFDREIVTNSKGHQVKVFLFPHPSGISHFWNEPENVKRARRFLRVAAMRHLSTTRKRAARSS